MKNVQIYVKMNGFPSYFELRIMNMYVVNHHNSNGIKNMYTKGIYKILQKKNTGEEMIISGEFGEYWIQRIMKKIIFTSIFKDE